MKMISATEANRRFSALLRDVSRGATITLTLRGRPVAIMAPVAGAGDRRRIAARRALLDRLGAQKTTGRRKWTRAELYDE